MPDLKVTVELNAMTTTFTGDPDEVATAFLQFLATVYPAFTLARRLTFEPDVAHLAERLLGVIEYTPEGLLLTTEDYPAEDAILLVLTGTYVGRRLGRLPEASLTANDLSQATGKALKTMFNQLAWMVDDGLVHRVERGRYEIASRGLKRFEAIIDDARTGRTAR
jgi:hypothetical protein